jgi:hypothetical protein
MLARCLRCLLLRAELLLLLSLSLPLRTLRLSLSFRSLALGLASLLRLQLLPTLFQLLLVAPVQPEQPFFVIWHYHMYWPQRYVQIHYSCGGHQEQNRGGVFQPVEGKRLLVAHPLCRVRSLCIAATTLQEHLPAR